MAPREGSHKRPRHSVEDAAFDAKKPRRSERLSQRVDSIDHVVGSAVAAEAAAATAAAAAAAAAAESAAAASASASTAKTVHPKTPVSSRFQVPTPMTYLTTDDSSDQRSKEPTATPPEGRPSQVAPRGTSSGDADAAGSFSSPPQDTQAFPSQNVDPNAALSEEVKDEVKEGVWGYLFPLGTHYGSHSLVLRRRMACSDDAQAGSSSSASASASASKKKGKKKAPKDDGNKNAHAGGYLIGRHPECDVVLGDQIVSNRHCLIFAEHKGTDTVAVLEDLSANGTFVNEALVGRNQRRELQENDEIAVLDRARFVFRYPRSRTTGAFHQQFTLQQKLGKGHFAEVFLCVEKATGQRYAVKIFTMPPGMDDRSKLEGLQQEIAVLMGVSHPNVLCLKDTFHEKGSVFLVLELAPEGELFNYIVMHQKLTEDETRRLFKQLFAGVKYLHERNIVHRDIKPENILLVDRDLHVKLADFGLAKIIGEESFTTTLCGTPSYVAPEILADSRSRMYTKAVDIWSLGVVLYICLCGFPPFSDELFSRDFPYNMTQQIRGGRFNYPSPYWDSVGDPALDLIDSMLMVDPTRRFTVDQCLAHPWMTTEGPSLTDSTDGLVGGVAGLQVNRRGGVAGLARERTLLSVLNRVEVAEEVARVPASGRQAQQPPIKIFSKVQTDGKTDGKDGDDDDKERREVRPADYQEAGAFMEHGDRGDPALFDEGSVTSNSLAKTDIGSPAKDKAKDKAKGKARGKGR